GLTTPGQRPSGSNMIFGGLGTLISRENPRDTAPAGPDTRSDVIVADNGDIFRLVNSTTDKYLQFNYDNYSATHIVPRAVRLLDYTPGGPDLQGTASTSSVATGDIGGTPAVNPYTGLAAFAANGVRMTTGSEIHAEGGDAWIYGGPGDDLIFGGGQNNPIAPGYGNDWVPGGRGEACIIAGDGQCSASREQTAEPLYGIAATPAQSMIATPGSMQQAVINVSLALAYTALLFPTPPAVNAPPGPQYRTVFENDIVYGGWGDDSIHATMGSDAISGAEAPSGATATSRAFTNTYDMNGVQLNTTPIESDWARPFNPGNVLGF